MGQGKIGSSLLPESIRRDKMWAEKTKWFIGAAALFLVGAAIPYGRWYFDNSQFHDAEHASTVSNIESLKQQVGRLDTEWSAIESAGAPEKQRMLNVLSLPAGHDLWPQINSMLYSTLPQNAPDARRELSSSKLDDIKKIKRGDRNQIIVSASVARYTSDLTPQLDDLASHADTTAVSTIPFESGGGGAAMSDHPDYGVAAIVSADGSAGPPPKPQRGFIITMNVSTPRTQGVQLIESFNEALKAIPATADRPLQVLQAKIVHQQQVKDDPIRMQALISDYNAKQAAKAAAAAAALSASAATGNPADMAPAGADTAGRT